MSTYPHGVLVRLNDEQMAMVDRIAAREERSRSWVVRRAIEALEAVAPVLPPPVAPPRARRPAAKGGYASPPEPVTALPPVPDGPAPGARPAAPARADYPKGQGGDLKYGAALRRWEKP